MDSTLYPKITSKLSEVRSYLVHSGHVTEIHGTSDSPDITYTPASLPIVGTVKLHGAHADILVDSNDKITLQSRNNPNITKENDNYDFAATMEPHYPAILQIRDRYRRRFQHLKPEANAVDDFHLLMAGEWIGSKIQRGLAISSLARCFVIVSVAVNGTWMRDTDFADIHNEGALLYNISRSGFYHAALNLNDLKSTLDQLDTITAQVEKECPFGSTFDVKGSGEGIVWKLEDFPNKPNTWFKVKGEKFMPTLRAPEDPAVAAEKERQKGVAGAFAERTVTEIRLEQGWDYLREMGIARNHKEIGAFLKWLYGDISIEERAEIKEKGIEVRGLKEAIKVIARPWYLSRVNTWIDEDSPGLEGRRLNMQGLKAEIVKIGDS
jgi:hypothetical protein